MFRQKYQLINYRWGLLIAVITISIMGVVFINSADSSYTAKQLGGLIACGLVMLALSLINYNYICGFNRILYAINIVLLVFVRLFGVRVGGAKRWINLGFTRMQPSEFTKVIMIIFVAVYIQDHEEDFNDPMVLAKLAGLIAVPLLLVLTEPDLSTTLDIIMILLAIVFVGKIRGKLIRNSILIAVPLLVLFIWYIQTPNQILLKDYQVTRIMTFINPSKYSSSSAYQQDNSVMAIGSGQLYGKGLSNNTISDVSVTVTESGLVSEQQTDFIFSVVGEEMGFVGSMIIIGLFLVIVIECLRIAFWARNMSGKLIAVGMAAMIGFQSFINIGVATAVLPNTGLPLPFVSYGLTSLLSCMAGMGIVLNIGLQKRY
jgi:rod shape determining protein RodA